MRGHTGHTGRVEHLKATGAPIATYSLIPKLQFVIAHEITVLSFFFFDFRWWFTQTRVDLLPPALKKLPAAS